MQFEFKYILKVVYSNVWYTVRPRMAVRYARILSQKYGTLIQYR